MSKITQTESPYALRSTHKVCSSVQFASDSAIFAGTGGLGGPCLLGVLFICCLLLCAGPAHAAPPFPPDDGPHNSRPSSRPSGRDGPPAVVRQEDAEGRRRAALMQESYATRAAGIDAAKRNSRMTPEERRDLRRQINEAGQDIYARPPGR